MSDSKQAKLIDVHPILSAQPNTKHSVIDCLDSLAGVRLIDNCNKQNQTTMSLQLLQ